MANEKGERIITEKREKENPRQVTEEITVQEPKTVMEERTIQEERTVMEKQTFYKLISASCKELDAYDIVNPQGEKLGNFDDVILDLQSGRIAYAVISIGGGFLGMNNKMVAVPWDALSIEGAEEFTPESPPNRMILNISKDKLESAPEFNRLDWPDYPDRTWLNENLYARYSYHPWWDTEYHKSDTTRTLP